MFTEAEEQSEMRLKEEVWHMNRKRMILEAARLMHKAVSTHYKDSKNCHWPYLATPRASESPHYEKSPAPGSSPPSHFSNLGDSWPFIHLLKLVSERGESWRGEAGEPGKAGGEVGV